MKRVRLRKEKGADRKACARLVGTWESKEVKLWKGG